MLRSMLGVVPLLVLTGAALGQNRTIEGSGNNLSHPGWGGVGTLLHRGQSGAYYIDGRGEMMDRGNPRMISNALGQQRGSGNARDLSSMFWQWGQFIDHDFALVGEGTEVVEIPVPRGDPHFDPMGTGTVTLPFKRSQFTEGVNSPRQHRNMLTHWIDGSMVYGSDQVRADALREFSGGRLRTSTGGFLPRNTLGLPNGGGTDPRFFLAGDVRANEQTGLLAMQTLFVREHNRWADRLAAANPGWGDEEVYQRARKIVGAEVQAITYNEWLPTLLGGHGLGSYAGYNDAVDPSIDTSFSTAAFRVGHTLLNEQLLRLNENGSVYAGGHLPLKDAFFRPDLITEPGGMDAVLRGLAAQEANEVDTRAVDAVRNMLFGPPGSGGMDLLTLNLERGRDHGIPDYNTLRSDYGLPRISVFSEVTSDPAQAAALEGVYGTVDNIDAWMGLMSEDHLPGASVGETLAAILVDQFERLRDGDRFFYLNDGALDPRLIAEIEGTRLSDIIRFNSGVLTISANAFVVPAPASAGALAALCLVGLARRRRA